MPTFLYFCENCDKEFEEMHSINTVLEECPACKEQGKEPKAPKRLIAGGSFILSSGGVGWSNNGYSSG